MPSSISLLTISSLSLAGPSVQTIFVFLIIGEYLLMLCFLC